MAKSKDLETTAQKPEKQTKKPDKNKKPNIFVRIGRKFKETFSELKRVTWPTLPQVFKSTGIVIAIVALFLIVATGINYGFSALLQLLTDLGGGV